MARKVFFTFVTAVLLVMGLSGVALATSANYLPPIYDDFAADGDLDNTYTRAEMEAYFRDGEVWQYGDPAVRARLDVLVRAMIEDLPLPLRHATPQEIYDDYAEDGHFDWRYSDADIQAYLNDPLIDQYGDPAAVAELDALLRRMLDDSGEDSFPLTGAQFALMIVGAAGLAGAGVLLRRLTRSRS